MEGQFWIRIAVPPLRTSDDFERLQIHRVRRRFVRFGQDTVRKSDTATCHFATSAITSVRSRRARTGRIVAISSSVKVRCSIGGCLRWRLFMIELAAVECGRPKKWPSSWARMRSGAAIDTMMYLRSSLDRNRRP